MQDWQDKAIDGLGVRTVNGPGGRFRLLVGQITPVFNHSGILLKMHVKRFAFIMVTSTLILSAQQLHSQASTKEKQTMKKSFRKQWEATTNSLHAANGVIRRNAAKEALYEIKSIATDRVFGEIELTAFIDSQSGKTYVGPKADFYFEWKSGIVGGQILDGGAIRWWDSLVKASNYNDLNEAISAFDSQVTGEKLVSHEPATLFHNVLKLWFVSRTPFNSFSAPTPLLGVELKGDLLKLDLKSADGKSQASIWIEPNTRKIVKAVQDNEQTFPKSK
jgi:hypothetical protein